MSSLQNTDAAFASCAPPLPPFEASLLLMEAPLLAARVAVRHRNIFHAHVFQLLLVGLRIKPGIRRNQMRYRTQLLLMYFDSFHQQRRVRGSFLVDRNASRSDSRLPGS